MEVLASCACEDTQPSHLQRMTILATLYVYQNVTFFITVQYQETSIAEG